MHIDFRGLPFDGFVNLIFDHAEDDGRYEWFYEGDAYQPPALDPRLQMEHLAHLFANPVTPLARFTDPQVSAGFWLIGSVAKELDANPGSLIEAGVDNVTIIRQ